MKSQASPGRRRQNSVYAHSTAIGSSADKLCAQPSVPREGERTSHERHLIGGFSLLLEAGLQVR
jgi:hypothetical protein